MRVEIVLLVRIGMQQVISCLSALISKVMAMLFDGFQFGKVRLEHYYMLRLKGDKCL